MLCIIDCISLGVHTVRHVYPSMHYSVLTYPQVVGFAAGLPLSMTTPPDSPALPTSAVLGQGKRRNSSASIASTGSTPRTVRQDVQSQSGYNLSVASIFDKQNA